MQVHDRPNDLSADLQYTSPNAKVVPNVDVTQFYFTPLRHICHPIIVTVKGFTAWFGPVHTNSCDMSILFRNSEFEFGPACKWAARLEIACVDVRSYTTLRQSNGSQTKSLMRENFCAIGKGCVVGKKAAPPNVTVASCQCDAQTTNPMSL